jgi:hypothetical protein
LLVRHDELRLQHGGDGPALLQRGGRAGLAEDRAPLLRALPPGRLHLVHSPLRHAGSPPGPALDLAGPRQPARVLVRPRRSLCCRADSSASCSPRCSAPRCRASRGS